MFVDGLDRTSLERGPVDDLCIGFGASAEPRDDEVPLSTELDCGGDVGPGMPPGPHADGQRGLVGPLFVAFCRRRGPHTHRCPTSSHLLLPTVRIPVAKFLGDAIIYS